MIGSRSAGTVISRFVRCTSVERWYSIFGKEEEQRQTVDLVTAKMVLSHRKPEMFHRERKIQKG